MTRMGEFPIDRSFKRIPAALRRRSGVVGLQNQHKEIIIVGRRWMMKASFWDED